MSYKFTWITEVETRNAHDVWKKDCNKNSTVVTISLQTELTPNCRNKISKKLLITSPGFLLQGGRGYQMTFPLKFSKNNRTIGTIALKCPIVPPKIFSSRKPESVAVLAITIHFIYFTFDFILNRLPSALNWNCLPHFLWLPGKIIDLLLHQVQYFQSAEE